MLIETLNHTRSLYYIYKLIARLMFQAKRASGLITKYMLHVCIMYQIKRTLGYNLYIMAKSQLHIHC